MPAAAPLRRHNRRQACDDCAKRQLRRHCGRRRWNRARRCDRGGQRRRQHFTYRKEEHRLGGSTGWSVGSISVSATPHQAAKGVVDGPEQHWRDMALFNGPLDGARQSGAAARLDRGIAGHVSLAAVARHPFLRADAGAAAYQTAHAQCAAQFALLHPPSGARRAQGRRDHRHRGAGGGTHHRGRPGYGRGLCNTAGPPRVQRAQSGGADQRRFHQRSRTQGPLHGRAGGQGLRRQSDRNRRRAEARGKTWRAYPQRRSRARARITFCPAWQTKSFAETAALAVARDLHGMVDRQYARDFVCGPSS